MKKPVKLFLRFSLATAFLSAVADRFGLWPAEISVWGNWNSFLEYTHLLAPWAPESLLPVLGGIATLAEIVFGVFLLIGFKTEIVAKLSGILLLVFALSMAFFTGIKGAFDFSVFTAAGAAFALATMKEKYLEIDSLLSRK